jgi:drug/metabolite transporter (DMT)-like permease
MNLDTHLLAILISFSAAIAAALNKLFVRLGTEEGETYDAVFVVIIVNVLTLVTPIAIYYYPNYGVTQQSLGSFVAAGLLGTLLGRVCLYTSIEKIGASRTSPLVSSHALVSAVLSAVILGESLPLRHAAGIVLIVAGVITIAWETNRENPEELSRRELLIGLSIPMGAALAYGGEPIFANLGFAEGTPAPVGLAIKTVAAVLGFTI